MPADTDARIIRSLTAGPLYRPLLELVVDRRDCRTVLQRLVSTGRVERATDIGPDTYRLVDAHDG